MRRPLSITIIGVIGVLWGFSGTVGGLGGLWVALTTPEWLMELAKREASPEIATIFTQVIGDPYTRWWSVFLTGVQTALNAMLLFGAIGLLRLQPKGWWLMMGYIIGAIFWAVADRLLLNPTVYQPFRERYQIEDRTARPVPRFTLGLLYPVISSYILTRPKIMALYKQDDDSPPQEG
jgi:hypothetical protein